jgi:hypothetical protein
MDNVKFMASWLGVLSNEKSGFGLVKGGVFDLKAWEVFCQPGGNIGCTAARIMPYESAGLDGADPSEMFSPFLWDSIQQAWDLHLYNPVWFATVKEMIRIAAKRGISIQLALFDNCQRHIVRGRSIRLSPWLNNVQGIPFYMASLEQSLKWVDKIFAEYGNSIDYEIGNELTRYGNIVDSAKWTAGVWEHLYKIGVSAGNISIGALPTFIKGTDKIDGENDLTNQTHKLLLRKYPNCPGRLPTCPVDEHKCDKCLLNKPPKFIPCYSHVTRHHLDETTMLEVAKNCLGTQSLCVDCSSDGVVDGNSKTDIHVEDGRTWRDPDYSQWFTVTEYLLNKIKVQPEYIPKLTIEILPHNPYEPEAWVHEFRGAIDAFKAKYGYYPTNYGKFPIIIPDPVTPPVVVTPPLVVVPSKSGVNLRGEWNNNWKIIVGGVVALIILAIVLRGC